MKSTTTRAESGSRPLHVLVLPKWYPSRKDPQLGDFIRKQTLAAATKVNVSVVHAVPMAGPGAFLGEELDTTDGLWELRSYYRASTSSVRPWRKLVNFLRYRRAMRAGIRLAVRTHGRPALVHVHILIRPALIAAPFCRRWQVPYIVSEHSSEFLDGSWAAKDPLSKAIGHRLMRNAAMVMAVSDVLGKALVQAGLCERYEVVPNVVPGMERPLPPPGDPRTFLMVADLVDRTKNVSGVLRALADARAAGADLRLVMIGDGPDRAMLEQLARDRGLNGHVRWLGRLPNAEVLDHMARTGSVIVNSNVETFSVVTGEALASGKPIIATRCGGPEAFVRPENGLLVPIKDEQALRSAMIELCHTHVGYDPARIRASVSERFSPDAVGERIFSLYQQVIARG